MTNYRGAPPSEDPPPGRRRSPEHLPHRSGGTDRPSLPPVATGIALGLWIAVMLVLALVVVPAAFGSCTGVVSP